MWPKKISLRKNKTQNHYSTTKLLILRTPAKDNISQLAFLFLFGAKIYTTIDYQEKNKKQNNSDVKIS